MQSSLSMSSSCRDPTTPRTAWNQGRIVLRTFDLQPCSVLRRQITELCVAGKAPSHIM